MNASRRPIHQRSTYYSLKEVSEVLDLSRPRLRQILKQKGWPKVRDAWNAHHPECAIEEPGGPHPTLFPLEFLRDIFPDLELTQLDRRTPITAALHGVGKMLPRNVVTVLEGRHADREAFESLFCSIVEHSKTLKIWAVSGSLFSRTDAADPIFKAFANRAIRIRNGDAEPPQMLFLHPQSRAARLRGNVEEGPKRPSFSIETPDVENLDAFMKTRMGELFTSLWSWMIKHHNQLEFALDAIHWTRVPPSAFLVWCEDVALVEPYGFGRLASIDFDEITCIGGYAPVLVVRPSTHMGIDDYHARLENGFNWIYAPDQKTAGVQKYLGWDIQKGVIDKLSKDFSPPLGTYPGKRPRRSTRQSRSQ